MAGKTHLDEIIDYNSEAINKIISSTEVMRLISNELNYNPDDEAAERWEEHVNDHNWVDDTIQEVTAYVLIDSEMVKAPSGSVKTMALYVQVVCHKQYMKLDSDMFPGVKGNRRDNICREIDLLLNDSKDFGIGRLELTSATLANAPEGFTSRVLTYQVPDFAKERSKL